MNSFSELKSRAWWVCRLGLWSSSLFPAHCHPRSTSPPPLAYSNSIILYLRTSEEASDGCAALTPYQTGPHSLSSQHCMAEVERPVSVCENGKVRPQFCLSVCGGDLSTSVTRAGAGSRLCSLWAQLHCQPGFSWSLCHLPGLLARSSGFSQNLRFLSPHALC